jgi:hypothetical protein
MSHRDNISVEKKIFFFVICAVGTIHSKVNLLFYLFTKNINLPPSKTYILIIKLSKKKYF